MELNWSTFILELINFLVLVWILKRFLYQPVLAVIDRRKARIEGILQDARAMEKEAGSLRREYGERLEQWEQEKTREREGLRQELDKERERALENLREDLDKERQRVMAQLDHQRQDGHRQLQRMALDQGARFSARLFARLSSPEVERKLLDMTLEDVNALPEARCDDIRQNLQAEPRVITVSSAYPLPETERRRLRDGIGNWLGMPLPDWHFVEDPSLQAGLRIQLGAWVLRANLQDELNFFSECVDVNG